MIDTRRFRLFEYGTMLPGEADAALLEGATPLGAVRTAPGVQLVEIGTNAALIDGAESGSAPVVGELYEVTAQILARCDVKRDHPTMYLRKEVTLEDGSVAFAYFLRIDQARGRRRVRGGDWKKRFEVARPEAGAFVRWARRPR